MKADLSELILLMIIEIPKRILMVRCLHDLNRSGFWSRLVLATVATVALSSIFCILVVSAEQKEETDSVVVRLQRYSNCISGSKLSPSL